MQVHELILRFQQSFYGQHQLRSEQRARLLLKQQYQYHRSFSEEFRRRQFLS